MDPNHLSGFDPRVQQQLSNLSQTQRGRRGSFSSQSTVSSYYSTHSTPYQPWVSRNSRGSSNYNRSQVQSPPGVESFPPLGSQPTRTADMAPQSFTGSRDQYTLNGEQTQRSQSAAREFFARTRGRGRGRGSRRGEQLHMSTDQNAYSRPPPVQQQLYNPSTHYVNSEQREANRQRHMMQADYLNAAVNRSSANMLRHQEIEQKHAFAMKIEGLARDVVSQYHNHVESPLPRVKLQAYGSLVNSFGTTGCDMDLLLTISQKDNPFLGVSEEVKRGLEKALLDQGIGARLLTNTRVPILRVCETPDPELLHNLRDHRHRWELAAEESVAASQVQPGSIPLPELTSVQEEQQATAFLNLDGSAAEVNLPDSPPPNHAKLEYLGDCGIQCDVNFGNHIALYNSKMLWTYGQCDPRVRHVGIFVKNWAKARDINTPYRGSLSSYGYILMVLHYLINVAHPPLLPNLQQLARQNDWYQTSVELVDGHDVRYEKDLNVIKAQMATMQPNRSTAGALLVGFFRYYGQNHAGFRWTEQVISIRTPGGILTKQDKDWVKAKWSEEKTNVRQRYLLAIEDPFEIEHNVGRTVGHNGIITIRDEFRRAWGMIEKVRPVQTSQGTSWAILQPDGSYDVDAVDLLSTASHGDLLRQDADNRKLQRQMRHELEMNEKMAKMAIEKDDGSQAGDNENGMWKENGLQPEDDSVDAYGTSLLIQNFQHQDSKVSRMRSRKPERERVHDMGEDYDESDYDEFKEDNYDMSATNDEEPLKFDSSDVTKNFLRTNNKNAWEDEALVSMRIDSSMTWAENPYPGGNQNESANSANAPNSNSWSESIEQGSTNSIRVADPDAVGEYIDWTQNSKGGRWLSKRDDLIRNGNFVPPTANDYARLHTAFPYNPKMTRQRLARLNTKLEAWYRDTIYPAFSDDHIHELEENSKVVLDSTDLEQNLKTWSESAETNTPAAVTSKGDWPVGEDIPWTAENDIGRWLLWRDRKLKTGLEVSMHGYGGIGEKLSHLYPYNPREKMATIDQLNAEVKTHFSHATWPRKEMHKTDQYRCTQKILDAIENVMSDRAPTLPSKLHFEEIYGPGSHDDSFQAHHGISFGADFEQRQNTEVRAVPEWSSNNYAGRWLQRRDAKVAAGTWQDGSFNEKSVFSYLDKLFPYHPDPNPQIRAKQNEELGVFDRVFLPSRPEHDGEPAVKAILQIVEGRQGDVEAERVRILINLFKRQGQDYALASDFKEPIKNNDGQNRLRESKVVQAFSERLKGQQTHSSAPIDESSQPTPRPVPISDELADIRRQRLAYFERRDVSSDKGKEVKPATPHTPKPHRRDSGAGGSWQNLSFTTADRAMSGSVRENVAGPGNVDSSLQSEASSFKQELDTSHQEPTPGPQSLFEHDQFSESNIVPIVNPSDLELDRMQLADIKNIKAGGNGCARGGPGPFLFESDKFSWGGAGAMAHRSDTTEGQWDSWEEKEPHDDEATRQLDQELPKGVD